MLTETKPPLVAPKTRHLNSNDRLFLNDANCIWRITSGALDLFALYKGQRRYLFSVKCGALLFSTALAEDLPCQLFAQATQATILEPLTQETFQDWMQQKPTTAIVGLEEWVTALSSIASNITPTVLPTPISTSGILDRDEVFQPHQGQFCWIRIYSGKAKLLGWTDLSITSDQDWIPFTGALWLQATSLVELERCSHEDIIQPYLFLNGVFRLQTQLMQFLAIQLQQLQQEELERLYRREQINQEAITKTNAAFIQVFQPSKSPKNQLTGGVALDLETALLMATGAVGHALGVTVHPPAASEDLRRLGNPLEAIARASHLQIRRVTLRDDWWTKDCGPMVTYALDNGRPVALLPLGEAAYELYDPFTQTRITCDRAIASQLSTTAYTFYRSLPTVLRPIDLVKFAIHGHLKELVILLAAGIATTLLGMVTPIATGLLVDQAIPNANHQLVWQMALGLIAVAFGSMLFQMSQSFAIMRLETYADSATQAAVWDRLLKLQPSFFRQYTSGELSARVSAISQIRQRLGSTVLKSLFGGIFSFLNLGLLFYYSMPLALLATLVAGINIAVTVIVGRLTLKKTKALLERQGKLLGVMMQLINGVTKFRVAGAESRAFAYWGQQYSQQLTLMLSTQGIEDNLVIINSLLSALTPAALFVVATHLLASENGFSLPTFLAFNAAFGTFISGATSLSTVVVDILEVQPIWQRVQPILKAVPEVDSTKADPGRLTGRVAIDHAVFRYRPDGALNLDDVSIHADPGEFIALVGPSGSGKSTLLRLLLGFDLPESGLVSFDGQDLASLDVKAVRRQLGVVLQNSRLMSASIFENIAGSALISLDEAWEAARMSGLAADIEAMPMGMHTVVSEGGTNLSGGQRQRLLIARALALRPRILLFDEATSALDNRTQQIVSDSLDRLRVTRIVVAHRLSTIRNADRIYVLQKGRLIQQGTFDQLAAEPGLFQQLVERQKV